MVHHSRSALGTWYSYCRPYKLCTTVDLHQARSTAIVDLTKAALLKALACTTLGNVYVFIEFYKQFVSIVKKKKKKKRRKKKKFKT